MCVAHVRTSAHAGAVIAAGCRESDRFFAARRLRACVRVRDLICASNKLPTIKSPGCVRRTGLIESRFSAKKSLRFCPVRLIRR